MTDDRTSSGLQPAGADPRPPEPERTSVNWSRADPMAVPTTAPLWTYEQQFGPAMVGLEPTQAAAADEKAGESARRRHGPTLGVFALLLAIAAAVAEVTGIVAGVGGDFAAGTVLAIVAIGASVAAVVVGIVGIVVRGGRALAILGAILGVVVNPLVLIAVLGFFAGSPSID